ncbi:MAG: hypothetical protein JO154_15570 [Chitinophaga sp.]|uniref:hypothetical protein n=1 Tax=Chitinophaga sp. TaxID=1869181 RepID=UPI0025BE5538|nr:hypothetical protein [Chitinophaga sp.]MBV8254021.1 hypothetical protein [Chitinophaga sp.]
MKKLMLLGVAATMLFFACSKDKDKDNGNEPATTVDYNGNTLTAAVKVNYGTVVKGDIPAASNDPAAPMLSIEMAQRTYAAIAGQYIAIPIYIEQGTMAGAYAKFDGADSYFNIDYAKPVNGREGFSAPERRRSDSSIIIKLPADFKDKVINVTVAIYDATGKTSNKYTLPVTVMNTPYSNDAKAFAGKWYPQREKDTFKVWHDNINTYESKMWYTCVAGKPQTTNDSLTPGNYKAKINSQKEEDAWLNLNANGSGTKYNKFTREEVNLGKSTCGALVYDANTAEFKYECTWGYNPKTKKMIFIYDFTSNGHPGWIQIEEQDVYMENGKMYTFDGYYLTEYAKK